MKAVCKCCEKNNFSILSGREDYLKENVIFSQDCIFEIAVYGDIL